MVTSALSERIFGTRTVTALSFFESQPREGWSRDVAWETVTAPAPVLLNLLPLTWSYMVWKNAVLTWFAH